MAASLGVAPALFIAAAGCALGIPLLRRWKLQMAKGVDLSPAMHWPMPVITSDFDGDSEPVLVMVTYEIDVKNREPFLTAMEQEQGMESHYRGVEFSLNPADGNSWHWTATISRANSFPRPARFACDDAMSGVHGGTQDDAMKACFAAIDDALNPKGL